MRKPSVQRAPARRKIKRSGVPITFYLENSLNSRLNAAVKTRRVGKSTIIRLALERLLNQLETGQLELPLGL